MDAQLMCFFCSLLSLLLPSSDVFSFPVPVKTSGVGAAFVSTPYGSYDNMERRRWWSEVGCEGGMTNRGRRDCGVVGHSQAIDPHHASQRLFTCCQESRSHWQQSADTHTHSRELGSYFLAIA